MKFGSLGLSLKALYRRLRPFADPVWFTSASMVDREVKPRPMIPSAPYESAGFWAEDTSR